MAVLKREKFLFADGVVKEGGGLVGLPLGVLINKTAPETYNNINSCHRLSFPHYIFYSMVIL